MVDELRRVIGNKLMTQIPVWYELSGVPSVVTQGRVLGQMQFNNCVTARTLAMLKRTTVTYQTMARPHMKIHQKSCNLYFYIVHAVGKRRRRELNAQWCRTKDRRSTSTTLCSKLPPTTLIICLVSIFQTIWNTHPLPPRWTYVN